MRKTPWQILLVLLLVFSMAMPAGATSVSQAHQQLQQAQQKLKDAKQRLNDLLAQQKAEREKLASLEKQLRSDQQTLTKDEQKLASTRKQYTATKASFEKSQKELDHDHQILSQTLVSVDEAGPGGLIDVLFSAQSFQDFVSRLALVKQILAYDFKILRQVQADEAKLKKDTEDMARQVQTMNTLVAKDKTSVTTIASDEHQASHMVSELTTKVTLEEGSISTDEANTAAMQSLLQALESSHNNGKGLSGIHFMWPLVGPITSPFGWRLDPVTHKYALHAGVDIGAGYGARIHAAAAGTVLLTQWITGYGYTVVLDHGNGVTTLYAHTERFLVKPGESVKQGQAIALVGATGWATGPHCHFEIRLDGKPLNPIKYLPPHS